MALGRILISLFVLLYAGLASAIGGSLVGVATPLSCSDSVFRTRPSAGNTETTSTVIYAMTIGVVDLRVRHSTEVNGTWTTVGPITTVSGTLAQIPLTSLTAGTVYYFHVDCRLPAAGGSTPPWVPGPVAQFSTQHSANATFTDVFTADAHWVGQHDGDSKTRQCYVPHSSQPNVGGVTFDLAKSAPFNNDSPTYDRAEVAVAQASLENPVNYFSLGDFYHTHGGLPACTEVPDDESASSCCWAQNIEMGNGSANISAEAGVRIRMALHQILPLRRKSTFWLVRGNHDNGFGLADVQDGCNHFTADMAVSITEQNLQMPNPNAVGVYPVSQGSYRENAASYTFTNGQVTYIVMSEYESACSSPSVCDATTGLPDSADDWTMGTDLTAWVQAIPRTDVMIVMSHHPFGGTTNTNCYFYGRATPTATVGGDVNAAWLGDEEVLHTEMATWTAAGSSVLRLYGHDHRFGFIRSRDNVHYFVVGRLGMGVSNWTDGVADGSHTYEVDWDLDGDGTSDWLDPASIYYAPAVDTDDFEGYLRLKYTSSAPTDVMFDWMNWKGEIAWSYQVTPTSLVRVNP